MKSNKYLHVLSIITIIGIFVYFFCVQFYQLPIGDDLLKPYVASYEGYLDGVSNLSSARILTFKEMVMDRWNSYFNVQARISSAFWGPLLGIVGQGGCSVIGSILYTLEILLICYLAVDNIKDIFKHPLMIAFIFIQLHAMTHTGDLMQMWTFVCHYGLSTFFCLLYWAIWKKHIHNIHNFKYYFLINIMGLITGTAHELLPLYIFILIFIRTVIEIKPSKWIAQIKDHLGLIIGYVISVLAPGNFVRATTVHDMQRISTSFSEKIRCSINSHRIAMEGIDSIPIFIMLFVLFIMMISLFYEKKGMKTILLDNLEYIVVSLMSILLWAIVAPPVARYSLHLWKALLLILILKNIHIPNKVYKSIFYKSLVLFTLLGLFMHYFSWMKVLVQTGYTRKVQIEEAIENHQSSVTIVRYPEKLNQIQTVIYYANDENEFNSFYGRMYYGIEIKIEDEE